MNDGYYGRCIECGLKYKTKADVTDKPCPKCGNPMRILNPSDDVTIKAAWTPLMELCAYALKLSNRLADLSPLVYSRAPRAIKAIRQRLAIQRQAGAIRAKINWHELELLGWWASQYLMAEVVYNPGKLVGPIRRITEFLVDLSLEQPMRPPLSANLKLAKDEVGRWMEENDKGKVLTADQVNSFPATPTEADVKKIEEEKRRIKPKIILGSDGSPLPKV